MTQRTIYRHWPALETSDGAGVRLLRALGARPDQRLDPWLMLDNFSSDDPDDYIAGFPAHPHRGFETVTYIIDGHMQHRDHLGNEGDLRAGGVQWMTAGRGIIHEEMPQQEDGRLRGFQVWLNLPAAEKMKPAHYEDVPAEAMPWRALSGANRIKLIAGTLDGEALRPGPGRVTEPIIADISLGGDHAQTLTLPSHHQVLLFIFEGEARVGGELAPAGRTIIMGAGDEVQFSAPTPSRVLLLSGAPLNEPVAQYGPFVMNTREEVEQAVRDFRDGRLTEQAR